MSDIIEFFLRLSSAIYSYNHLQLEVNDKISYSCHGTNISDKAR